jgi:hypothetical protein
MIVVGSLARGLRARSDAAIKPEIRLRPSHRHRQSRHSRQRLRMRGSDVLELPRQHRIDRRPLPPRQSPQHVPLIPRHPRPQLHQPNRLRQDAGRVLPESLFDDAWVLATVTPCTPRPCVTRHRVTHHILRHRLSSSFEFAEVIHDFSHSCSHVWWT